MEAKPTVRSDLMKHIDRFLRNERFEKILDVGGNQETYDYLRKKFPDSEIIVFNIDRGELPEHQERKDSFLLTNAEVLPFKKDSFDFIFAREVIEHFYRPDKFIEEVKRVLKRNGKILVSTPNLNSWHIRLLILLGYAPTNYTPYPGRTYGTPKFFKTKPLYDHVRVFPYRALKEIFSSNGFVLEQMRGVMTYSGRVWMKRWRKLLGIILPNKCREGILLKARLIEK